jgi:hypothetical protein
LLMHGEFPLCCLHNWVYELRINPFLTFRYMYKISSCLVHFKANINWSIIKHKGWRNWLNTIIFSLAATQILANSTKNLVLMPTLWFNLRFSS